MERTVNRGEFRVPGFGKHIVTRVFEIHSLEVEAAYGAIATRSI